MDDLYFIFSATGMPLISIFLNMLIWLHLSWWGLFHLFDLGSVFCDIIEWHWTWCEIQSIAFAVSFNCDIWHAQVNYAWNWWGNQLYCVLFLNISKDVFSFLSYPTFFYRTTRVQEMSLTLLWRNMKALELKLLFSIPFRMPLRSMEMTMIPWRRLLLISFWPTRCVSYYSFLWMLGCSMICVSKEVIEPMSTFTEKKPRGVGKSNSDMWFLVVFNHFSFVQTLNIMLLFVALGIWTGNNKSKF